jgi:hypothetical protein
LINDSTIRSPTALIRAPASGSHATLERLRAPSVSSSTGVTLAGQTFGTDTGTGRLGGNLHTISMGKIDGGYVVSVPAASAALITIPSG